MQATVEVVYHANSVRMTFFDREKAKLAYDVINDALKEYRQYQNDQLAVVEVDAEGGLSTLKLERMDAVLFNEPQEFNEDHWRDHLADEKRVRDLREEFGLPPLSVGNK